MQLPWSLPPELGNLVRLTRLYLSSNQLAGPLPPQLAKLGRLTQFYYGGTYLCEPQDAVMQAWLAGIEWVDGTNILASRVSQP